MNDLNSALACVKEFEASSDHPSGLSLDIIEQLSNKYNKTKNNTTKPAPPILGAGGVKRQNKQLTLKLK